MQQEILDEGGQEEAHEQCWCCDWQRWCAIGERNFCGEDTKEVEEKVKIVVHDSSADIITFRKSVGGKSAQKEAEKSESVADLQAGTEIMSFEEGATPDDVAQSLFLPKMGPGSIQKNKGMSLYSSSSIENIPRGLCAGNSSLPRRMNE